MYRLYPFTSVYYLFPLVYSICSRQCILFVALSKKTQLSLHWPGAVLIHPQTPPSPLSLSLFHPKTILYHFTISNMKTPFLVVFLTFFYKHLHLPSPFPELSSFTAVKNDSLNMFLPNKCKKNSFSLVCYFSHFMIHTMFLISEL